MSVYQCLLISVHSRIETGEGNYFRSLVRDQVQKNSNMRNGFPLPKDMFEYSVVYNAVNREDKRSRRYRDRDFAEFERSRRYRDRYHC